MIHKVEGNANYILFGWSGVSGRLSIPLTSPEFIFGKMNYRTPEGFVRTTISGNVETGIITAERAVCEQIGRVAPTLKVVGTSHYSMALTTGVERFLVHVKVEVTEGESVKEVDHALDIVISPQWPEEGDSEEVDRGKLGFYDVFWKVEGQMVQIGYYFKILGNEKADLDAEFIDLMPEPSASLTKL